MYPNPQQALPLPSRPNVEQYKKLAKDLVKACKAGADVAPDLLAWDKANADPEMLAALTGRIDAVD